MIYDVYVPMYNEITHSRLTPKATPSTAVVISLILYDICAHIRCGSRGALGARAPPRPPTLRPKFLPPPRLRCAMSAKFRLPPPLTQILDPHLHIQQRQLLYIQFFIVYVRFHVCFELFIVFTWAENLNLYFIECIASA